MKGAARRPVLVPVLVLCAVLMTWAEAAHAGGEPVVPFPDTSVSGASVSGASVSGTSVFGTDVPGAVADGEGKSAEASPAASYETRAPDAGAEVPGTSGPAVDAGASDGAVPDGGMGPARVSAAKPAMPAGGSRLLRALAELPGTLGSARSDVARSGSARVYGTSVSGTSVSGPGVSGTRVFAAERCPRALLRRLLAGAAGEADALSALGIEREILILCRERQEILAGLFETEARLSELRDAGRTPETQTPVAAAGAAPAFRAGARGETAAVETAAPSPLRAVLVGAPEARVAENANEADADAAETRPPRYVWFSIIGTAGALRAGVTDGTGVWFVREGDPLPGGVTVAAIAGRPPGVRVTGAGESLAPETLVPETRGPETRGPEGGEAVLLPFGARPGGAP